MLTIEKIYIREIVKISFDVDIATILEHFQILCFKYYFLQPEKEHLGFFALKHFNSGKWHWFLLLPRAVFLNLLRFTATFKI